MKKLLAAILAALTVLALFSCSDEPYGHAELVLDLPDEYEKIELENFDAAYQTDISVVGIVRISFNAAFNNGIPDTLMPDKFGEFYMKNVGRDVDIETRGDIAYCEYTDELGGVKQFYVSAFFRSKYAYFIVMFACPEEFSEEMRPLFLSYADGAVFVS